MDAFDGFTPPSPATLLNLPVELYGPLAMDLVLQTAPLPELLASYEINEATLARLLDNPTFQAALKDTKRLAREAGPDGSFTLRARALAESMMPDIYKLGKHAATDAALRHKIFETLLRVSKLEPAKPGAQAGNAMQVVMNFGAGIRGIGPSIEVPTGEPGA